MRDSEPKTTGTSFEAELSGGLDRIVRADALRLRDLTALMARVAIHSASNGRILFRATLAPWGRISAS